MFTFWPGNILALYSSIISSNLSLGYSNVLLCSASVDGRVYVWKITEGQDDEDKPQITGKIVIAIQIVGEGESVHPRVCWHCHKQVCKFSDLKS